MSRSLEASNVGITSDGELYCKRYGHWVDIMPTPNESDTSKQVVVLPFDAWRAFTGKLISDALNRPGATLEQLRGEIQPVLDIEALARYSAPTGP